MIKLKKLKELLFDEFERARQRYPRYYRELPINERAILLESEHGKKIDGNIFYLIKRLALGEYGDREIYISSLGRNMRKFQKFLTSHGIYGVRVIMLASDEYFRLLASAKYLVNDTSFGPYFLKKEGQIYLNTWHGTPIKCLGRSDKRECHRLGNIQRNFIQSDYLLCQNDYTREILVRDYMLENLANGRILLSGYPRNEPFFDPEVRRRVRDDLKLGKRRVYAYMPTYRGGLSRRVNERHGVYLAYHLFELEKRLLPGEILYVKLHPLAREQVDFSRFKRIKSFPERYETYELLSAVDVLITDYSSVAFDFALTGRKILLFNYDEAEYLDERGAYVSVSSLPFEKADEISSLLEKMRDDCTPDYREVREKYCPHDSPGAAKEVLDALFFGKGRLAKISSDGRERVLIYAGNLAKNGITSSLLSLLSLANKSKRNYFVAFRSEAVGASLDVIRSLPKEVGYLPFPAEICLPLRDKLLRLLFKKKIIPADVYAALSGEALGFGLNQLTVGLDFDALIQFGGYESEMILLFSTFDGNNIIFVHNDMTREISLKKNQRRDVLRYAYRRYRSVAVVTPDLVEPTFSISSRRDNIRVVRNTIDIDKIKGKSKEPLARSSYAECSVSHDRLLSLLESGKSRFINVARFSPEKGQKELVSAFAKFKSKNPNSLLLIVGGYSVGGCLGELKAHISELGLSESVILIRRMKNPYALLARCDFFILSSHYEGFGLVLAEADILSKPVVSTDVVGPRGFMREVGGRLVEDSERGLLSGFEMLERGEVPLLSVNFEALNAAAIKEFESLLGGAND